MKRGSCTTFEYYMHQKPKYSPDLHRHNAISFLKSFVIGLYIAVLQLFTPPQLLLRAASYTKASVSSRALFAGNQNEHLFGQKYVQDCTTKSIFKLGKNKFDRSTAIRAGAGHGGWQPLGEMNGLG